MGQFFIDESIHSEAGFIIAACVYTDADINSSISEIIKFHGFPTNSFEFKSSVNFSKEPKKAKVREDLKDILYSHCKLGIVVLPSSKRDELGFESIKALKQFIDNNECIIKPVSIYFDQGFFKSINKANLLINKLKFSNCSFFLEQNSQVIKGIQLADLAAHISSIQLKDAFGLITKKVKPIESLFYESAEINLGFEMWAILRYNFFNENYKPFEENPLDGIEYSTFKVEPYGLYISEYCDFRLTKTAREKFGKIYLGCIH
jgi:hypothetical protein